MKIKYFIIFILLLFVGCNNRIDEVTFFKYYNYFLNIQEKNIIFENKLKESFFQSHQVFILDPVNVNSHKALNGPLYTWFPLLEFHGPLFSGCLAFFQTHRVTNKGLLGLYLYKNSKSENCDELEVSPKFEYSTASEIYLYIDNTRQINSNLNLSIPALQLTFIFNEETNKLKKHIWKIPLTGMKKVFTRDLVLQKFADPLKIDQEIYRYGPFVPSSRLGVVNGLLTSFMPFEKNVNIGSKDEEFEKAVKCHDVDDNCQVIQEFSCHRCKYGFYEVVKNYCPNGGPKFCGEDHCGEEKYPACIRGFNYQKKIPANPQDGHYESVYCAPGLEPFTNEDKVVICI